MIRMRDEDIIIGRLKGLGSESRMDYCVVVWVNSLILSDSLINHRYKKQLKRKTANTVNRQMEMIKQLKNLQNHNKATKSNNVTKSGPRKSHRMLNRRVRNSQLRQYRDIWQDKDQSFKYQPQVHKTRI